MTTEERTHRPGGRDRLRSAEARVERAAEPQLSELARRAARRYESLTTAVGLIGNTAFLLGSIGFALDVRAASVPLFLLGSSAMLVGAVGRALARHPH